MASIFNQISTKSIDSNTFDLSHDRKMSLNMGDLVPIFVMETVPGDKISMSTSQMLRFAPMIAPVMHRINLYTHFFFVPNRILWSNWRKFITGGEDGLDTSVFPTIQFASEITEGTLGDYLGLPTVTYNPVRNISAMPFAAYQSIYHEYYRDQNLVPTYAYALGDGDNAGTLKTSLRTLRKRAWAHDYFTSALPWTQKGAQATIPLGSSALIKLNTTNYDVAPIYRQKSDAGGALMPAGTAVFISASGALAMAGQESRFDPAGTLFADLSTATASTINDLRRAFKLQEWLEKNARGGSRYIEQILSHFGVRSSDARLQRPEFLGGGSSSVVISEVLQTTGPGNPTGTDQQKMPLGTQGGHGISVGASNSFSYYCEEHGYIIGIMSVMPKSAYQQGIPKHFTKFDKFDYFWPSFAHLGEQPIDNEEIYVDITNAGTNAGVFGYTPRYAEYKHILSSVHGAMRSTLGMWHLGRKFANLPALNQTFIEVQPTDTSHIFAVTTPSAEKLYAHVFHTIKASRKMPFFGTPSL